MSKKIFSVREINQYIKNLLAQDFVLGRIQVQGEVSNCKYHTSGHIYFSLKDPSGVIPAVMFSSSRLEGLSFQMKNGDKVVVSGRVSVYERGGYYQLYAERIEREGEGELFQRFEALKKHLEEMGMFAAEYKKPLPAYPHTVGIVTAQTGAAIRDIQNIAGRRNPYIQLLLYPAQVQGQGAAESVCTGIRALREYGADVIIIGRGGGSIEDLWAFNEEIVAREIFACPVPVVSAVGHETDFTIADFVADLRAPTPSAAAELVIPDITQILSLLEGYQIEFRRLLSQKLDILRQLLEGKQKALQASHPGLRLQDKRQACDEYMQSMERRLYELLSEKRNALLRLSQGLSCMDQIITDRRHRLEIRAAELEKCSPLWRLQSGYAYLRDPDKKQIRSVRQLSVGDSIQAVLADGSFMADITEVLPREDE